MKPGKIVLKSGSQKGRGRYFGIEEKKKTPASKKGWAPRIYIKREVGSKK